MVKASEKVLSQVVGGVKAVKATIEGLAGVFRQLAREHGEVTALLLRVKMSDDPKLRAELFPMLRYELLSHEHGETEVVYAKLNGPAETRAIVSKHRQEAVVLEKLIEQLSTLGYEEDAWATAFAALVDTVQRHAKEEEEQFFPAAQYVLGAATAQRMLSRYEDAKAAFLEP